MVQISKKLVVKKEVVIDNAQELSKELDFAMADYYCSKKEFKKGLDEYKRLLADTENSHPKNALKKYIDYSLLYASQLTKESQWADAVEIYKDLITRPGFPINVYKYIGLCMKSMGNADLAIKFLKRFEEISNDKEDVYVYLADLTYTDIKDNIKAIEYYEKALVTKKNNYALYNMLGHLYSTEYQDKFKEKQIEYLTKAYELAPNNRIVVKNLAYVYGKFQELQKADEFYAKLMYLNPTHSDLHSYGAYLVKNQRFIEGFKFLQHRFQKEDLKFLSFPKIFENKKKRWNIKMDITNKHVLVHFEQGFGDTIMFVRFVDELKSKCKKISLVVQKELKELMEDSKLGVDIYTESELDKINYDCYIPLMDLPIVCQTRPETIPLAKGYLKVKTAAVNAYKKKYINQNDKIKIGIAFEGTITSKETDRDIPLEYLYPIMKLPNVEVYSFQVDDISRQMDQIPEDINLIRLGSTFKNWKDTAAAIKCMDMMVTTDNGVMNLSGALGAKTFGLFNKLTEYRWYKTTGDDIGWYKSIKPYQAPTSKAWDVPVKEVIKEIKKYNKERKQKQEK